MAVTAPELKTRKPTGLPSWPIILLAGQEKAGKTYHAALASASDLIGRTLWVGVGEDDPDEYGALDGARFEIVEHDGTYRGIINSLVAASMQDTDGKPNLLVLDSGTRLWDLLCDEAQASANRRAAAKAQRYGKPVPDEDVPISMDLWNLAKQRWQHVIDVLRDHKGPSLVTARLETVTVMENGEPTKDKTSKVKAEKSLPYDVGVIVEMPAVGEAWLRGVRSLRFKPADTGRTEYKDFTVDDLWHRLGLTEQVGERTHSGANANPSSPHRDLLNEIALLAEKAGVSKEQINADWMENHDRQPIREATDLGSLELLRDELNAKAETQDAA